MEAVEDVERRVLEHHLERGGHRLVPIRDRLFAPTRWSEFLLEFVREDPLDGRFAFVPGHPRVTRPVLEVRQVELEPPTRQQPHQFLDLVDERRLAVWGEAHDLELVTVLVEPEILGDRQVKQPERMRKVCPLNHVQRRTAPDRPRCAHEIAEPVDGRHCRFIKRRDEIGTRQMRGMMLDPVKRGLLVGRRQSEGLVHLVGQATNAVVVCAAVAHEFALGPMADRKCRLAPEVRPRIARDSDVVNIAAGDAGHLEAAANGAGRESRDVLDPPESLLFDGGDEHAVAKQNGGDVPVIGVDSENVHEFGVRRGCARSGRRALSDARFDQSKRQHQFSARALKDVIEARPGVEHQSLTEECVQKHNGWSEDRAANACGRAS